MEHEMSRCNACPYGGYDKLSDICDGCRNEPHTGWGGFRDNKIGRDFRNEQERDRFVATYGDDYEDEDYGIGYL